MANAVGFGFDTSFLKNLELADKKLNDLMNSSNQMTKSVMSAFQQITTQGVVPYVKSLEQQLKVLDAVKASITDSAGQAKRGFGSMKTDVMDATNSITQLVTALKSTSQYQSQKGSYLDENIIKRYRDLRREIESLEKAKKDAQNTKNTSTSEEEIKNASKTLRAVNKLIRDAKAEAKNIEVNYKEEAERAKNRMALAGARERKKIAEREARDNRDAQLNTPEGALNYARSLDTGVKSLNTMRTAVSHLKNAQADLNLNTSEGKKKFSELQKEIDKLEKQLGKTTRSHDSFARSIRQFAGTLVSIQTLHRFFTTLVDIRGEFEKQHRSLQVLIGDLDMANDIWDKTVALAVKSPFSVKDLVTYTKQLSAYRVEADKLYETNKMLADISAGLGVDMNRLILAYGQVKAANYLRGTELRQFSEAGINILGELATYFTELEGRAVSVGDVFERVSKRMVSFEDVNAVLHRVTDEGGVFYQMQEKQAQTLIGMRMNLKDTVDIMLNDIGYSNEEILKGTLRITKEILVNWREVMPIINAVGIGFITYFGAKQIAKIVLNWKTLVDVVKNFGTALRLAAMSAGWIGALVGIITAVGTAIYFANKKTTELEDAMKKVETQANDSLGDMLVLYKKLADTVNDTTESYEKQEKALADIKRRFDDILPQEYLEEEYIRNKAGLYSEATDAMLAYYDAKVRKQKEEKVNQLFDKELTETDIPELASGYAIAFYKELGKGTLTIKQESLLKGVKEQIITQVVEDIKNRKIGVANLKSEIEKRLLKYAGIDEGSVTFDYSRVQHNINDLEKTLVRYLSAMSNITGMPYETAAEADAAVHLNAEKEKIEQVKALFNEAIRLYDGYANKTAEKQREADEDVQRLLTTMPDNLAHYSDYLMRVFALLKTTAEQGAYEYNAALQGIQSKFFQGGWSEEDGILDAKSPFNNSISGIASHFALGSFTQVTKGVRDLLTNFTETINNEGKKLEYSTFQKAVIEGVRNIAEESKVAVNDFVKYIPRVGESLSQVRTEVEGNLNNMRDQVKQYENSIAQGQDTEHALDMTKEQYEHLKKLIPVMQKVYEFLGGDPEKKKKRTEDLMDERIKVIDDMHKKYEELRKRFDEGVSIEGAFKAYKDAFADAYSMPSVKTMSAEEFVQTVLNFPNESAIVKYLNDVVLKLAKDTDDILKVQLAKGKYEYDIELNAKVKSDEDLLREMEGMFSNYEVSLELDKLNIPKDLQKQLFNVDNITLPELRKNLEANALKFIGTDMEDEYIKILDKLSKLEDKQLEERAKKYSKYLIKAQGERVKIKMEELRAIEELETLKLTKPQKTLATQAIQEESQQKLDKLKWEDFKDSGMYVQLFEDMEFTSTRALRNMRDRLIELKGELKDLDADDLRNLYNQIEKLDKELASRNPFKTLTSGVKDYFQAVRDQKRYESELETQDSLIARTEESELKLEESLYKKKREFEKAQNDPKISEDERRKLQLQITGVETMLATQRSTSAELRKQRKITQENLDETEKQQKLIKDSAMEAGAYLSEAGNALPQIAGSLENVFGSMDAKTKDMVDTTAGILNASGGLVQGLASGNYIQAVTAAFQLIGEIAQIGDKKKERQIQKEIELVEELGKQYEKLEKAVNEAYAVDLLKENFDLANKNIDDQIASYEEMMRLEDDKKKTDKKRIEEWKDEIESLREQQEELLHSQVEELGGTYDYRSATRDFVDAWVDAFKETGDGLSGLKDNFKDFYANIVAEQAVMQGASNIMKPLLDEINKSLENDFEVTEGEWNNIKDLSDKQFANLDEFLKGFYSKFSELTSEEGELSGLQRGIQGITEQQADILSAYLNTIRFFVSDSNSQLKELVALQGGGNQEVNPMLSELRAHTELITSIRDMFSSVIGRGSSVHSGAYLKVVM